MNEYFMTLYIGADCWDKLVKAAEFESRDDLEAFAALLLQGAIEERDAWRKAELFSEVELEIEALQEVYKSRNAAELKNRKVSDNSGGLDDGIPF